MRSGSRRSCSSLLRSSTRIEGRGRAGASKSHQKGLRHHRDAMYPTSNRRVRFVAHVEAGRREHRRSAPDASRGNSPRRYAPDQSDRPSTYASTPQDHLGPTSLSLAHALLSESNSNDYANELGCPMDSDRFVHGRRARLRPWLTGARRRVARAVCLVQPQSCDRDDRSATRGAARRGNQYRRCRRGHCGRHRQRRHGTARPRPRAGAGSLAPTTPGSPVTAYATDWKLRLAALEIQAPVELIGQSCPRVATVREGPTALES